MAEAKDTQQPAQLNFANLVPQLRALNRNDPTQAKFIVRMLLKENITSLPEEYFTVARESLGKEFLPELARRIHNHIVYLDSSNAELVLELYGFKNAIPVLKCFMEEISVSYIRYKFNDGITRNKIEEEAAIQTIYKFHEKISIDNLACYLYLFTESRQISAAAIHKPIALNFSHREILKLIYWATESDFNEAVEAMNLDGKSWPAGMVEDVIKGLIELGASEKEIYGAFEGVRKLVHVDLHNIFARAQKETKPDDINALLNSLLIEDEEKTGAVPSEDEPIEL
ncbi:MAG: hypothetical protein ABIH99_02455 [Candidatus Micrarchaeota archaeon]